MFSQSLNTNMLYRPEAIAFAKRYKININKFGESFFKTTLRQFVKLENSNPNLVFNFGNQGTGSQAPTALETFIKPSDVMLVQGIGIGICRVATIPLGTTNAIPEMPVIQTYPNPTHFDDPGPGFTLNDLMAVYHGKIKYTKGDSALFQQLLAYEAYFVPDTQQGVQSINVAATAPNTDNPTKSAFAFGCNLINLQTWFEFTGDSGSAMGITLPNLDKPEWASTVPGIDHYVVMELQGAYAVNILSRVQEWQKQQLKTS